MRQDLLLHQTLQSNAIFRPNARVDGVESNLEEHESQVHVDGVEFAPPDARFVRLFERLEIVHVGKHHRSRESELFTKLVSRSDAGDVASTV